VLNSQMPRSSVMRSSRSAPKLIDAPSPEVASRR
jgi:hypothetical protein